MSESTATSATWAGFGSLKGAATSSPRWLLAIAVIGSVTIWGVALWTASGLAPGAASVMSDSQMDLLRVLRWAATGVAALGALMAASRAFVIALRRSPSSSR